ncbi:hypothetical protein J8273_3744 [Carpediemonas membranifera]|uniref:Uncharacterized protein n=1 Tax=Carpediemonas membranifera TaxID=201153 RepID=A0A8J6AUV7_9EUKA|nr:hypothetical protein J8273_3744 [Carpediemonas membranifera]|eukprot:KAG9394768.1 hypothetical protein J8273_3744 [Carpediemonas membranifera]
MIDFEDIGALSDPDNPEVLHPAKIGLPHSPIAIDDEDPEELRAFSAILDELLSQYLLRPDDLAAEVYRLRTYLILKEEPKNPHSDNILERLTPMHRVDLIIDKFSEHAGMAAACVDLAGRVVSRAYRVSTVCNNLIRPSPKGGPRCTASDQLVMTLAHNSSCLSECHSRIMHDGAAAISLDGRPVVTLMFGAVRTVKFDQECEAKARRLARDIDCEDEDLMVRMIRKNRYIPLDKLQIMAQTARVLAQVISEALTANQLVIKELINKRMQNEALKPAPTQAAPGGILTRVHELNYGVGDRDLPQRQFSSLIAMLVGIMVVILSVLPGVSRYSDRFTQFRDVVSVFTVPALSSRIPACLVSFLACIWASVLLLVPLALGYRPLHSLRLQSLARWLLRLCSSSVHRNVFGIALWASCGVQLAQPVVAKLCPDSSFGAHMVATGAAVLAIVLADIHAVFQQIQTRAAPLFLTFRPNLASVAEICLIHSFMLAGMILEIGKLDPTRMTSSNRVIAVVLDCLLALLALISALATLGITLLYLPNRCSLVSIAHAAQAASAAVASVGSTLVTIALFATLSGSYLAVVSVPILPLLLLQLSLAATPPLLVLFRQYNCEYRVLRLVQPRSDTLESHPNLSLYLAVKGTIHHALHRQSVFQTLSGVPEFALRHPADMLSLPPVVVEIGCRPLIWHRRSLRRHRLNPTQHKNLERAAAVIISRICTTYAPQFTAELRLCDLILALRDTTRASDCPAMFNRIQHTTLDYRCLSDRVLMCSIVQFIDYQLLVHSMGDEKNASAVVNVRALLARARENHLSALRRQQRLWPLFLEPKVDLPAIIAQVKHVDRACSRTESAYRAILAKYPESTVTREWYVLFLENVLRDRQTARLIKAEMAEEASMAGTSDYSASSVSTASTTVNGRAARSDVEKVGINVIWATVLGNIAAIIIIGAVCLTILGVFKTSIAAIPMIQILATAMQQGVMISSMATVQGGLDLYPGGPDAALLDLIESIDTVREYADVLVSFEDAFEGVSFIVRRSVMEVPDWYRVSIAPTWTMTVVIPEVFSTVVEAIESGQIVSDSNLTLTGSRAAALDIGLYQFIDTIAEYFPRLASAFKLMAIGALLVLLFLTVADIALAISLAGWLFTRVFPSIVTSCDNALLSCLGASNAQVRRQLRLLGTALGRFTDLAMYSDTQSPVASAVPQFINGQTTVEVSPEDVRRGPMPDVVIVDQLINALGDSGASSTEDLDDSLLDVAVTGVESDQDAVDGIAGEVLVTPAASDTGDGPGLPDTPTSPFRLGLVDDEEEGDVSLVSDPATATSESNHYDSTGSTGTPAPGPDGESDIDMHRVTEFLREISPSSSASRATLTSTKSSVSSSRFSDQPWLGRASLIQSTMLSLREWMAYIFNSKGRIRRHTTAREVTYILGLTVLLVIAILIVVAEILFQQFIAWETPTRLAAVNAMIAQDIPTLAALKGDTLLDSTRFIVDGDVASARRAVAVRRQEVSTTIRRAHAAMPCPRLGDQRCGTMVPFIQAIEHLHFPMNVALCEAAYAYSIPLDALGDHSVSWDYAAETHYDSDRRLHEGNVWYNTTDGDALLTPAEQREVAMQVVYDDHTAQYWFDLFDSLDDVATVVFDSANSEIATLATLTRRIPWFSAAAACFVTLTAAGVLLSPVARARIPTAPAVAGAAVLIALLVIAASSAVITDRVLTNVVQVKHNLALATEASRAVVRVVAYTVGLAYSTQRYLALNTTTSFFHLVRMLEAAPAVRADFAANCTQCVNADCYLDHIDMTVKALSIAARLAASVNTNDSLPAALDSIKWNVTEDRILDITRYNDTATDLARPKSDREAIAWSLCTTDPVLLSDAGVLRTRAPYVADALVSSAQGIVEYAGEILLKFHWVTLGGMLLPFVFIAALVVLPAVIVGLNPKPRRRVPPDRLQLFQTVFVRYKITFSAGLLATTLVFILVMAITAGFGFIAAVVVPDLSSLATAAPATYMAGASVALGAAQHRLWKEPEEIAAELGSSYSTVSSSWQRLTVPSLVFAGTTPAGITARLGEVVSGTRLLSLAGSQAESTIFSQFLESTTATIVDLDAELSDLFNARFARVQNILGMGQAFIGAVDLLVLPLVVAGVGFWMWRTMERLRGYSRALFVTSSICGECCRPIV